VRAQRSEAAASWAQGGVAPGRSAPWIHLAAAGANPLRKKEKEEKARVKPLFYGI